MSDEQQDQAKDSFSRRAVLGIGFASGVALGAGPLEPSTALTGSGSPGHHSPSGQATTLARTLLRGSPGPGGYRKIVVGPGEPHLVRTDLVTTMARRHSTRRRPVIALGQLTDMHVVDAQSPARVEFLDHYNDPECRAGILPSRAPTGPRSCSARRWRRPWSGSFAWSAAARRPAGRLSSPSSPATTRTTASTTSCAGTSTCWTAAPSGRTRAT